MSVMMDPGNIDLKVNFSFFTVTPPAKVVAVNIDTDTSTDIEIVEDIGDYINYFLLIRSILQNFPPKGFLFICMQESFLFRDEY